MSPPVTLYRFQITVSDVDRNFYETLDFRAAQHPSEAPIFLVTRVLAFALSVEEGLTFTAGGLSTPDEPAIKSLNAHGGIGTWIDIGNPSARRVHKASKSAERVKIFTYKNPKLLLDELNSEHIHRAEHVEIFSFAPAFLDRLVDKLQRQNVWQLIRNESSLMVNLGDNTEDGEIFSYRISVPD
jgi:uncharacterized protein YaeQ